MSATQRLLQRLDEIGQSLARSGHALGLLGLGSVGLELERLDAHSDLDFFAIVQPGHKAQYLTDLSWLSDIAPVAYAFRNTADGYKLLYADDIFCEFAIFEPDELKVIPFAEGRWVWRAPGLDESLRTPQRTTAPDPFSRTGEWQLGEALTCLYVGLKRHARGETLSAQRFIQHYAVDRVLELAELTDADGATGPRDPFSVERRLEQRRPALARELPRFVQGYGRNRESALALLSYLARCYGVSAALAEKIGALCAD